MENNVTTRYLLDLNSSMPNVLMETDASGTTINYYVYASGMLISRIKPDGDTRYYHYDSRGSTIAMTNDAQQITHKYSYDPYGKVITMQEEDGNAFRFVGGYGVMDEYNGLSHMRARYYDQNLGRFISEDPLWDTNSYAYCNNNPISFVDSSGKIPSLPYNLFTGAFVSFRYMSESLFLNWMALDANLKGNHVQARILSKEADKMFIKSYTEYAKHVIKGLLMDKLFPSSTTNTYLFGKTGSLKWVDMRKAFNKTVFNKLLPDLLKAYDKGWIKKQTGYDIGPLLDLYRIANSR